jgi:CubicO group peptidase (beta-lactamase class C family)
LPAREDGSSTSEVSDATWAAFEETIERLRANLRIPGLSAAVVRDGELVWSQGFGLADVDNGIEATPDTPYGLASVTKPFAAFLLMRQVEAGRLDLDTPVTEFGIALEEEGVTVRHLLSHTSEGVPGSRYSYSGNRYSMLTGVIEQLYGDSFRAVLRREILEPLNMRDSVLNYGGCGLSYYLSTLPADDPERAFEHVYAASARPYVYDASYEAYPTNVPAYANAAAGLISTVVDLARFAAAIEEDALVSADTKKEMFTPTRLNSGAEAPYGLGFFTETYDGTKLVWHYGYGAYSSLFLMIPEKRLTFIALANSQNLSRPFGLGQEGVSVLGSPLALAFFKEFVVRPQSSIPLPEIDWAAAPQSVGRALSAITAEPLRRLYEQELWTYRKLYAGAGRKDIAAGLLTVHGQVFPDFAASPQDRYEVALPGPYAPPDEGLTLTEEEAARWAGRFLLRSEDAASGLPLEIRVYADGGRIMAVPTADACQEFLAIEPTRLASAEDRDIELVASPAAGPFTSASVLLRGEVVGIYERAE